ncbi:MAG: metallophosphoesterase [Spirochaetes bacterium]|nr:metallophosphoesterase [Spirochaetota bacterium]
MRIIYCTDLHGGFAQVYHLFKETIADVYVVAGDILDMPFYSLEQSMEYFETQNIFHSMRREEGGEGRNLEEYVEALLGRAGLNDYLEAQARRYLDLTATAAETMEKKYRILENIFSTENNSLILTIPGNHDMDLGSTALRERNLHLKTIRHGGVLFAGYGGAAVRTPGFPESLLIPYRGRTERDTDSELYRFLDDSNPDIIIAHHPAHGVLDDIGYYGSWGSPSLRTYCDNHPVLACLTGHVHENWGVRFVEGTLYLNPSNFGEVMTGRGETSEGGFFYEFPVENGAISEILFRKIVEYRVYDIAEYTRQGDAYIERIIDGPRHEALKRISVVDDTIERYNQIPELKVLRDIRNFFRIHQTKQTEERIINLEKAVASLGTLASHIALDLVGSVNMGMALDSSDVDAVLYLRDRDSCGEDYESCDFARNVAERIKDFLKDRHGFQIIDFINLDVVEESIRSERVDCDMTQRFSVYRSFCRPINYRIVAPVEDLLNANISFRIQAEENMRSYLRILGSTWDIKKSFDKYMVRLRGMGVHIPEQMLKRIEKLLQKNL